MSEEDEEKPVVVAQLASDVPYSCVSSSPDGRLVIMGGKDTVQIVSVKPSGLKEVRSIRISQFFQAQRTVGTSGNQSSLGGGGPNDSRSVRDIFSTATSQNTSSAMTMINVNVSDVAWSICQTQDDDDRLPEVIPETSTLDSDLQDYGHDAKNDPFEAIFSMPGDLRMADESLIAAAGSNGVVLIWRACDLLKGLSDMNRNKQDFYKQLYGNFGTKASDPSSSSIGYPEAVLVEHSKAVKVAWHPNLPNLLLTASLDGTAQLWERFEIGLDTPSQPETSKWSWLSSLSTAQYDNAHERSFSWKCKQVFKPNCGGIRAVQWSTFSDDLFAMVTNNGFLVVYYTIVPHRPAVRIAAHAREATTVDWYVHILNIVVNLLTQESLVSVIIVHCRLTL
jgi:WD40 repeat protein